MTVIDNKESNKSVKVHNDYSGNIKIMSYFFHTKSAKH